MKKLIGIAAVVLMMTSNVLAKNPGLELMVKENKFIVVELDGIEAGSFLILKDLAGEILFKNVLNNDKYEAALDFEVIPVGTYFLEFENEQYVRTTVIEKTRKGLEIKGAPRVTFKPFFELQDKKVRVFLTNHEENTTSVTILDGEGKVVGKSRDKKYAFTRTLDFSEMPAGEYVIIVRSGQNSFQHKVNFG